MKTVMPAALFCATAMALTMGGTASAEACTVRVTTWGGSYQKSYQADVAAFEKAANCQVEWVVGSIADFREKARLGQIDVVTGDIGLAVQGEAENLWMKLDPAKIPNMANLYDNAKYSESVVFANVGDYALAYNSKKIEKAPESWEALWDPAYKNRVATFQFDNVSTLGLTVMEAEKNGGSIDNIEPGLKKVAELVTGGNAVAMVSAETQLVSLFELEEAWIGVLTTGRFKELWDKGADFVKLVRPPEGTFPVITTIMVSKSTTVPDAAMQFVNHVLSKQVQETFATKNLYAPTVKNAELPADFKYRDLLISGDSFDRLFIPDQKKVAAHRAEWREQFMRLTSQ
jgi:putative spermidine/putrescine transport system substrate-binding protein